MTNERPALAAFSSPPPAEIPPAAFLSEIADALEKHHADEQFSADCLCRALLLSPAQGRRKIKSLTGQSPGECLLQFRLEKARDLLRRTDLSIGEIAARTGFHSQNYLARAFRKAFGIAPREARRQPSGHT